MLRMPFDVKLSKALNPKVTKVLKSEQVLSFQGVFGQINHSNLQGLIEEIVIMTPAVHSMAGIRSALEMRLISRSMQTQIEVIFLYDLLADSDFEGDEFLFHLGLGSEMIVNLKRNEELILESKMDPGFDVEILGQFRDMFCLYEEINTIGDVIKITRIVSMANRLLSHQ